MREESSSPYTQQVAEYLTFSSYSIVIIEIIYYFFNLIEFVEVIVVHKIIQVSGVQFYKTSPVYCTVCSPPKVKSPSITIYPPLPS